MSGRGFPRPLPSVEGDAERYWKALSEGRIELPRCRACARWIFPPRPFCPGCHGTAVAWEEVAGRGRVHTFTVVHRPTHPWFLDKAPYVYALVELDIGVRLPAMIVGCEPREVSIGLEVEAVFEEAGEGVRLLFFRAIHP